MSNLWTYSEQQTLQGTDLAGFSVEAIDGGIGKIDEAIRPFRRARDQAAVPGRALRRRTSFTGGACVAGSDRA